MLVLGLTSAAYQSQIFRGAIQSLPLGQMKAARALGHERRPGQRPYHHPPQALRLLHPAWSNEYSIILKDWRWAFVLGVTELMARTHFVSSRTFQHCPSSWPPASSIYVLTYGRGAGLRKLERKSASEVMPMCPEPASIQPVLRLEGIKKRLGGKEIIRGVSLTVKRGELKVLIGPSGGGKSTLLLCINFLHLPDEGKVYLGGQVVSPAKKRELYAYRQKVGMIFQEFNLFDHLTALGNVTIALTKVRGMAKESAGRGPGPSWPGWVSWTGPITTGPALRRPEAAGLHRRALAMDPEVILLDEPHQRAGPRTDRRGAGGNQGPGQERHDHDHGHPQIGFAASLADEFLSHGRGIIIEQGPPVTLMGCHGGSRTQAFCNKISELYGEAAWANGAS